MKAEVRPAVGVLDDEDQFRTHLSAYREATKTADANEQSLALAFVDLELDCAAYLQARRKAKQARIDSDIVWVLKDEGERQPLGADQVKNLRRHGHLLRAFHHTKRISAVPSSERSVRPLTRLPITGAGQATLYDEAVTLAGVLRPTAKQIRELVEQRYPRAKTLTAVRAERALKLIEKIVKDGDLTLGDGKALLPTAQRIVERLANLKHEIPTDTQAVPSRADQYLDRLNGAAVSIVDMLEKLTPAQRGRFRRILRNAGDRVSTDPTEAFFDFLHLAITEVWRAERGAAFEVRFAPAPVITIGLSLSTQRRKEALNLARAVERAAQQHLTFLLDETNPVEVKIKRLLEYADGNGVTPGERDAALNIAAQLQNGAGAA